MGVGGSRDMVTELGMQVGGGRGGTLASAIDGGGAVELFELDDLI
jgi:hypothetical protein